MRRSLASRVAVLVVLATAASRASAGDAGPPLDFRKDIRPILSNSCFLCHGPDAGTRKAGLRLDMKDGALAELESGSRAIVPGDPESSELYLRITADASDPVHMPPQKIGKDLSPADVETIKRWIEQGAPWSEHWSFKAPVRPAAPEVKEGTWARNPIDRFILARLEKDGVAHGPEADKVTLIRRLTFDLTGLPPTPAEVDAFLTDISPDAYEKLVERLLGTDRHAEHLARNWLDAARYGDTHGLHLDNERSLWPYRDWVIRSFRENKRFDEFTVEQLAGDLLPNATRDQKVATGFNRCNITTGEGGSIDAEYYVRYAVDRVETTSTVWMGLTTGCAVCHDHKYDPISQKEFYQFYAYFYSLSDKAMDGNALLPPPSLSLPSPEQEKAKAEAQAKVQEADAATKAELTKVEAAYADPGTATAAAPAAPPADYVWVDDVLPVGSQPTSEGGVFPFVEADRAPVFAGTKSSVRKATGLSQHFFTGASPGLIVGPGDVLFAYVFVDPFDPPKEIMLQFNDGTWEHRAYWGEDVIPWGAAGTDSRRHMGPLPEAGRWVRLEIPAAQVGLPAGSVVNGWAFTQHDGLVHWDAAGLKTSVPQGQAEYESLALWEQRTKLAPQKDLPKDVLAAIQAEPAKRTPEQSSAIKLHFFGMVHPKHRDAFAAHRKEREAWEAKIKEIDAQVPVTMVTAEMETPREAFILDRGQYDKPKDKVERGTPSWLPPAPADAPANRLGLARWLTMPEQPLVSRVVINRYWQLIFGTGLVKTTEDFGSQGEWPTHPELLDWLAVEFRESGWDVRHMLRLIVNSSTYRQSAKITPQALQADPANRLLGRGARFRLDAEVVRDNALFLSGLLVEKVGGRSVKPYQPEGLWEAVGFTGSNTAKFVQDHGDSLYRRSMYTFWKRTSPPPSMAILDAPTRENCTVRRPRTNTPLAALALMNDVQYAEASRKYAERILKEGGRTPGERAIYAFRSTVGRAPTSVELEVILGQYAAQLAKYSGDREAATKLVSVGESPRDAALDVAEHAAWSMVANLLLNLDETITRP
jgi:hypothetical protein